jgi:STAS domain
MLIKSATPSNHVGVALARNRPHSPSLASRYRAASRSPFASAARQIQCSPEQVLQTALEAVDPSDCTSVVVDLAGVSFMDCRGLNALLIGRRGLARRNIELHVRNAQPQARRLFEIAVGGEPLDQPRDAGLCDRLTG